MRARPWWRPTAILFGCAVVLAAASACGSSTPAPPSTSTPAPPSGATNAITVRGTEHFGWDQIIDGDVSQYDFVAYVDDAPESLPDATCQNQSTNQFGCSALLPAMSAGAHRFQVAAGFTSNGARTESAKSSTLNLVVAPAGASSTSGSPDLPRVAVTAADGTAFIVETLATGLDSPGGLARTSDGRVFVAERSGDVRVWQGGLLLDTPALRVDDAVGGVDAGLIGIALDPAFDQNRKVYLAYTAKSASGAVVNRIERFREVGNIFGEKATLLEDASDAAPQRTPRIRVGPDGKLYVTFPTDAAGAQSPATYAGKLLRLNDDGTTPRDNPRSSPIVSDDEGMPIAFGWQPGTGQLWQIARDWSAREMMRKWGVTSDRQSPAMYLVPAIDPSGAAFYASDTIAGFRGDMFVSALSGRQIQRVRFDANHPGQVIATERLLEGAFGRIGDIVAGADGALYFCTSNRGTLAQPSAADDRLARIVAARATDGRQPPAKGK